jgi:hypothetical protein
VRGDLAVKGGHHLGPRQCLGGLERHVEDVHTIASPSG